MTDEELVKRLRKLADDMEKHAAPDWDEHENVASAADRIETLERDKKFILEERDRTFALMLERRVALTAVRDEANKRGDAWRFRADIAEAKLAKAVEALRFLEIAATGAGVPHPQERKLLHETIHKARATLAEMELVSKGGEQP
jgi:hypothetical protein